MANFFQKLGVAACEDSAAGAREVLQRRQAQAGAAQQHEAEDAEARRLGLLCYARAAFFLERYLSAASAGAGAGDLPPFSTAVRVVEELVDLSEAQAPVLLGLTTVHSAGRYLAFHHVNAALMAIAFARELGLTRPQMRDVALAALFHEVGRARLPQGMLDAPGALSAEVRKALGAIPGESLQLVIDERQASQARLRQIVLSEEVRQAHELAERDEQGVLLGLAPARPRSAYAELIAICCVYDALRSPRPYRSAYRPEAACLLMWSELRERFDPELLRVFMRVMRLPPLKLQGKMAEALKLEAVARA